jgi:hypothetical protein
MTWKTCAEPALGGDSALCAAEIEFRRAAGDATLEFGRFRMLLRRRQLLAEGAPSSWDRALSPSGAGGGRRVAGYQRRADYPCVAGIIVSEENLKVQISRLRMPLMKTATLSAPSLTAANFTRQSAGVLGGTPLSASGAAVCVASQVSYRFFGLRTIGVSETTPAGDLTRLSASASRVAGNLLA